MANGSLYIGMDGGGTSTRAVVATRGGEVVGVGLAAGSNPQSVGEASAEVALRGAAEAALARAGARIADVAGVFVGLAGVVDEDDHALATRIARRAGLGEAGIDHDIRIALMGGLVGAPGIALIAGTGSSGYGRNATGESCQAGGYGSILDDGGSAYGLGLGALRAAVRVADGREGNSKLLQRVLAHLKLPAIRGIVQRVYQVGMSKTEVAELAPLVLECWEDGDEIAAKVVRWNAGELVLVAETIARKLGLAEDDVIYTGSVLERSVAFRRLVAEGIGERLPKARLVAPRLAPVLGAMLLAYERAGISHDEAVHERLATTYASVVAAK